MVPDVSAAVLAVEKNDAHLSQLFVARRKTKVDEDSCIFRRTFVQNVLEHPNDNLLFPPIFFRTHPPDLVGVGI